MLGIWPGRLHGFIWVTEEEIVKRNFRVQEYTLNNHYFRFFKSRQKCIYQDIFSEGAGVQNNQYPPGVQI